MKFRAPAPIVTALIVVSAVAAAWAALATPVLERAEMVAASAIERKAASFLDGLGVSVAYTRASPRLFGSVSIEGLKLSIDGKVAATASVVVLSYDPGSIASGRFIVEKLRVEDLSVDSTYVDSMALVRRIGARFPARDDSAALAPWPAIELRRARLGLAFAGGASAQVLVKAADLVFDDGSSSVPAAPGTGAPGIRALGASAAGSLTIADPSGRLLSRRAVLPFSVTATLQLDSLKASVAAIVSADSDTGRLAGTRMDAEVSPGGFHASVAPANGLDRLEASWDGGSKRLMLDAAFSDWQPSSLFKPSGRLASLSPWLDSVCTGSLSVDSDLSATGTSAAIDVSGTVPLETPGRPASFSLVASGGWEALRVRVARLSSASFDASFTGDLSPATMGAEGRLVLGLPLEQNLRAETEFVVVGSGRSWFAYANEVRAADTVIKDATVSVEFAESGLSFHLDAALPSRDSTAAQAGQATDFPALKAIEAASASSTSRLAVEGTVTLGAEPYAEAVIRFGATPLGGYRSVLESALGSAAASALAPLSVEGEVSLYSDFSALSFNASRLLLVYDGKPGGFGVVSFSGGLDRLEIRSLDATVAGYRVSGSASIDYGSRAGTAFETAFVVQGVPYAMSGAMVDGALVVSGDYGLRLFVRGTDGEVGVSLAVTNMPVPMFGTVSFMSARSTARFSSQDDWNLLVDDFSLSQPPGSVKPLPSVSASGAFDESGGRLGSLSWRDKTSSLDGAMDVTWRAGDGFQVSVNGSVAGNDGEYYLLNGEYRDRGVLDAIVSVRKAPLVRLGIPALRGVIDLDSTITGTVSAPALSFSFTMNGGQRSDDLPFAAGTGIFKGGQVTLEETRGRFGKQLLSNLSLRYRFADGNAALSSDVAISLGKKVLIGRLDAEGASTSTGPKGPADASLDRPGKNGSPFGHYRASGVLSAARWDQDAIGDIPFSLESSNGDTSLLVGRNDEFRARLGAAGELSLALATTLPVSLNATGVYAQGSLSVDVADARVDLPFLFNILALPVIKFDSGVATGSLRIRGKAIDPSIEGAFQFENFYVSVPDFVSAPIGPITEPLYFTGRTMETSQPGVACGDALVLVSLESSLQGGLPRDIRIAVQSGSAGLVPVSTKLLGLDIKGRARPDLVIEVGGDGTRIVGSILMDSGEVVLTTGLVKQKESPQPASNLSGSLALSFGTAVRVYFPGKRLPVIYGQADPASRLDVAFDAARGDYSLKGTTMLRGGSVFYIQRNFYLKHATIEFDEDADQFDPRINAEAETRTSSPSGTVVVTLRAVDRRLSDLSFTLESIPSMSEANLQQLLGQNLLGSLGDGRVDPWRVLVENSDLIPELNVTSILERNLQSVLGLDLFVLRSLIFQRWLYDLSGLSGSTSRTSLADYLDDTALVAGKYLGDKVFIQLMLALSADPLASTTTLSLDSDFSIEWKAPHFTLNWSIQPKNLDSLFIEDQSFSFLWRIPLK